MTGTQTRSRRTKVGGMGGQRPTGGASSPTGLRSRRVPARSRPQGAEKRRNKSGRAVMDDRVSQGEAVNALIDAAYAGRISRRSFIHGLIAAGIGAAVARDMAEHAALAQANQSAQLANLKS